MDIKNILAERGKTHGDFTDNAEVAQTLKAVLREGANWQMRSPVEREAMEMICHKLARWVSAPISHPDNAADIAGYAQLVVDRYE
jgi:hypothetical protein